MSNDLEVLLLEVCSIYQSIVVDLDTVLADLYTKLEKSESISIDLIVETRAKYLPKLHRVKVITETIIKSAESSMIKELFDSSDDTSIH